MGWAVSSSLIQKCETCHFARRDKEGDLNCHYGPPAVFLRITGPDDKFKPMSVFPLMDPDLWCGKWAPKGAPPTNG
jgi:hypothetical protein